MGPHLQSQILAIFNFYMSMKKYEICIKTLFAVSVLVWRGGGS